MKDHNQCRTDARSTFRVTFQHLGLRSVFTVLECWQPTKREAQACADAEFRRGHPGRVRGRIVDIQKLARPPEVSDTSAEGRTQ